MLAHEQHEELDAGPRKGRPGAERLCAITREVKPVENLIRFVVGPEGIVPDLKRKLPGRGLWITADKRTLKDAVSRNVFARGFKRDVRVTAELADLTERLLQQTALDALSIAGKSGLVLTGFAKVEAAIAHDDLVGLIHASDAAADGVAKLAGAMRHRPDEGRLAAIRAFSTAQLDLALGRSNVVHAALLAGPATDTFLARLARFERFRTSEPDGSGGTGTRN
jgi:predicted RNA-binding protein YlxR (DUF448 family)